MQAELLKGLVPVGTGRKASKAGGELAARFLGHPVEDAVWNGQEGLVAVAGIPAIVAKKSRDRAEFVQQLGVPGRGPAAHQAARGARGEIEGEVFPAVAGPERQQPAFSHGSATGQSKPGRTADVSLAVDSAEGPDNRWENCDRAFFRPKI